MMGPRRIVATCVSLVALSGSACLEVPERLVSKSDTDAIFAMTLKQWNVTSHNYATPEGWRVEIFEDAETGNTLASFDPPNGMGLGVHPMFADETSPPVLLIISNYLPKGMVADSVEQRLRYEEGVRADLGAAYDVEVLINPEPKSMLVQFDLVQIMITLTK